MKIRDLINQVRQPYGTCCNYEELLDFEGNTQNILTLKRGIASLRLDITDLLLHEVSQNMIDSLKRTIEGAFARDIAGRRLVSPWVIVSWLTPER